MVWADELRSLTGEISGLHEGRANAINQLKGDILKMKSDTQKMRKELNTKRSRMREDLLAHFNAWDKARTKDADQLRSAAQALLAELKEADKTRAKEVDGLRTSVQNFLAEIKKERDQAAAAWQELAASMGKTGKEESGSQSETKRKKRTKKA